MTALVSTPVLPCDADLTQLEGSASELEDQLDAELHRLGADALEVDRRLHLLRVRAAKAVFSNPGDDASAIRRQVGALCRPQLDSREACEARARAQTARLDALDLRSRASASLQRSIDDLEAALVDLGERVASSEEALCMIELAGHAAAQTPAAATVEPPSAEASAPGRRESPRCVMMAAVDFSSESNFYAGFSTDVSEGGLFIATVMAPPAGTAIDLSFTLPGDVSIAAVGVVRWTRDVDDGPRGVMPGAGVQFVELATEAAEAIRAFVARREPLFFDE